MDIETLEDLVKRKLVSVQEHPELPYYIWNYTNECQYKGAWDENTMVCRGLITDEHGNIIARPFKKFFNLSEHEEKPSLPKINWKQDFSVSEKLDGSLGIFYRMPDEWGIATRGSFTSEQAIEAMKMLEKLNTKGLDDSLTYLVEILYPENRIVVDYGERRELVLLDVIDNETGASMELQKWADHIGIKAVKQLHYTEEEIRNLPDEENREGVVVRFNDGMRVKVKLEEYVRLHRLITGTNARHIWEILKEGGTLEQFIDRVPDEYYSWVQKVSAELAGSFEHILDHATNDWENRDLNWTRKEFAEYAKQKKYPGLLFSLYDNHDLSPMIWKMIKPKFSAPFKDEI